MVFFFSLTMYVYMSHYTVSSVERCESCVVLRAFFFVCAKTILTICFSEQGSDEITNKETHTNTNTHHLTHC